MKKKDSLFYRFMHGFFTIGLHGYYKKVHVQFADKLPAKAPVIFIANHHNSLVDPCVMAVTSPRAKHFLVRSDVFKKGLISRIFDSLNMMPIYRERDGEDYQAKNVAIFEKCVEVLNHNRQVLIYPEGSHNKNRVLREMKGGFLKIASDFIKKHDKAVYIVPVGLVYSSTEKVRGELFVNYGSPVKVDASNFDTELIHVFKTKLSALINDYEEMDYAPLLDYYLFDGGFLKSNLNLKEKHIKRNQFLESFKAKAEINKEDINQLIKKAENVQVYGKQNRLATPVLNGNEHTSVTDVLLLSLSFPVFIYGAVNSFLPFKFPFLITRKIKDKQFKAPVDVLVGTFSFILFWTIQTCIVWQFIGLYALLYLLSLPVTALLANWYVILFTKVRTTIFKRRNKKKSSFQDVQKDILDLEKGYKSFI